MRQTRVAVHDEHEIFRRGLRASLEGQGDVVLREVAGPSAPHHGVDVAIVSAQIARRHRIGCPLVVCAGDGPQVEVAEGNVVAGVLPRGALTSQQLHAAVRAAAGLPADADGHEQRRAGELAPRALRLLELLADGRSTREIACDLSYSERTIKKHIQELEHRLGARSRAQVVAQAIRQGII